MFGHSFAAGGGVDGGILEAYDCSVVALFLAGSFPEVDLSLRVLLDIELFRIGSFAKFPVGRLGFWILAWLSRKHIANSYV